MENKLENKLVIGKIRGVHGVKGLVKVESFSDYPQRFAPGNTFGVAVKNIAATSAGAPLPAFLIIEQALTQGKHLMLKFAGVNDRSTAQALTGLLLTIPQSEAAPLSEGSYYYWQLEGLAVWEGDANLGVIERVESNPANDLWVVKNKDGGVLIIPALKTVIKKVDLTQNRVEVELPDGLKD